MAGSIILTNQNPMRGPARPVQKVVLQWTSSAGGAVSGITTGVPISGQIVRVVFIPGTGGVQPSNLYSVTLKINNGDGFDDGLDVLSGQGASLSNAANTEICPTCTTSDGTNTATVPRAVNDILELDVTAAGNAKQGTVVLYVR